ncbi:MAG: MFS transporter, partial [Armatimonadetes bacterium]|nr:MFS transporter [Armatimonadota bacterium]
MAGNPESRPQLTTTQWLICGVAALGFLFDTYELLMLPLVGPPAIEQLGGLRRGTPEFLSWVQLLFYVPAIFGGIFGLLGGYLTDRFGRQRVLVFSILLYAFSAMAAGLFATSLPLLLFFRTTTFIGVCVEFVAAVAWLAELFSDPRQREAVLGWTQAFGSLGGLAVSHLYTELAKHASSLPEIQGGHEPWRYILISGVLPAIPLILIRPFLPESAAWAEKKAAGTLRRPSIVELFQPRYLRTTVVCTLLMACAYGVAFGAIQQISQIVPGLPGISELPRPQQQVRIGDVQRFQEIGGLTGRVLLAILALYIVKRRTVLHAFQIPSLFLIPFIFFVWG